jgi:hypothetical protein
LGDGREADSVDVVAGGGKKLASEVMLQCIYVLQKHVMLHLLYIIPSWGLRIVFLLASPQDFVSDDWKRWSLLWPQEVPTFFHLSATLLLSVYPSFDSSICYK